MPRPNEREDAAQPQHTAEEQALIVEWEAASGEQWSSSKFTVAALKRMRARLQGPFTQQNVYQAAMEELDNFFKEKHEKATNAKSKQLTHLLKQCNMPWRKCSVLLQLVDIPNTPEFNEKVERMQEACQFQGFNPFTMIDDLDKWNEKELERPFVKYELEFKEKDGTITKWSFSNHEQLHDDVEFMIIIFLNRGAVIDKLLEKSKEDFVAVLKMLVEKYHVSKDRRVLGPNVKPLGARVVTLPRITACFPQSAVTLMHRGHGRCIANISEYPWPRAIFAPMFPSVCPNMSKPGEIINIHPQLVLIAVLVDNVIQAKSRKMTPLQQIWAYYLASYNSQVCIQDYRRELCYECDILTQEHAESDDAASTAKTSKESSLKAAYSSSMALVFNPIIVKDRVKARDAILRLRGNTAENVAILAEMDAIE